ncbi:Phage-related protein [Pseudobutyrivibrio sp. 49]|nr:MULTISPECIES: type II toxin-antitoxin system RelE/ParE family toxin [unclassified Pseudobutyrivibrio]SDI32024.1 Phage-related protein [Pseudobutyrivibrio sp. 49]SFN82665.1 Phage-related protein [Pseudobutyrivibrio sp. UC1225]
MNEFKVELYQKANLECPVEEFLDACTKEMRAKITGDILVLQEKGNAMRAPYTKYLEDGIFELRTKQGSNISRVLFFFYYGGKIILTNGFIKKSQKTPRREIDLAKKYRSDYLERNSK